MVTVIYDLPHGNIQDSPSWKERREMATEWREQLALLSGDLGITVNPVVAYLATGSHNADLPLLCRIADGEKSLEDIIQATTIILAMVEFSATAPLYHYAKTLDKLRVDSMPGVARFMEKTGLSADYTQIAGRCQTLKKKLDPAVGATVTFSTGHRCYFDLSDSNFLIVDGEIQ